MQLKKIEIIKHIKVLSAKEEKNKETLEVINKHAKANSIEINKNEDLLKKLEIENENLKDKLDVVENNICGFIKEMTMAFENDDTQINDDDDGTDDFNSKITRKKKLSLVR